MPQFRVGEVNEADHVSLEFKASTTYDDNVLSTRSAHENDIHYLLAPRIDIQQTHGRLGWTLQYAAGASAYQNGTMETRVNHAFSGSLDLTATPRLHLRLRQDYTRSSNPFSAVDSGIPPLGIVNSPNVTVVAPASLITTLTSGADLRYALGRFSNFGISGNFAKTDYSNWANGTGRNSLLPGETVRGSAYYSHQFAEKQSAGLQYVFTDMLFSSTHDRVQTHSSFLFYSLGFGAHSTLTLYGGPEFTKSRNVLPIEDGNLLLVLQDSGWSPAVGGTYSWVDSRTDVSLNATRRVSDGGGIMQAATSVSGAFSATRQVTRKVGLRGECTLADNRSLDLFSRQGRLRSLIARAGITRRLTDGLDLDVGYDRVYQNGTGNAMHYGNHNRVQLSLRYSFTRPLGR